MHPQGIQEHDTRRNSRSLMHGAWAYLKTLLAGCVVNGGQAIKAMLSFQGKDCLPTFLWR